MIPLEEIARERGLDPEDVVELLQDFLEYTEKHDLIALQDAFTSKDPSAIRVASHSIKGAALNLQLTDVADLAKQIEEGSQSGSIETLQPLADALRDSVRAVADVLGSHQEKGQ
jgi:HPt (histidine-containing phosphotransfer) domain-containing protein